MDRVGQKASPLSGDELKVIFKVVADGDGQEKARQSLPGRHRNTTNRAYNVVAELERRGAAELKDDAAAEIAEAAKYSTTARYVQNVFLQWKGWKKADLSTSDLALNGKPDGGSEVEESLSNLRLEKSGMTVSNRIVNPSVFPLRPWVVNVTLANKSREQPIGIEQMRLVVSKGEENHISPHIGKDTYGSHGEVPFAEAALPSIMWLEPARPIAGKLRFLEPNPFKRGEVQLRLQAFDHMGQCKEFDLGKAQVEISADPTPAPG